MCTVCRIPRSRATVSGTSGDPPVRHRLLFCSAGVCISAADFIALAKKWTCNRYYAPSDVPTHILGDSKGLVRDGAGALPIHAIAEGAGEAGGAEEEEEDDELAAFDQLRIEQGTECVVFLSPVCADLLGTVVCQTRCNV